MRVTLRRFDVGKNATSGLLFVNGIYHCHTMENTHKRIKPGTYGLILSFSPKFTSKPRYAHDMIEVVVPGTEKLGERDQILFHIGNDWNDSLGCVLLGDQFQAYPNGDNIILSSSSAYEREYPVISSAIKDGPVVFVVSDPDLFGIPDRAIPVVGPANANPVSVA